VIPTIRTTRAHLAILLLAVTSLAGTACSPTAGPLGTPSSPIPASEAPVEVPSIDATPGTPAPSATTSPGTSAAAPPSALPTTAAPTSAPSSAETTIVRAYFFLGSLTGAGGLVPVLREIPKTQAVGGAALRALLAGPSVGELAATPALYTDVPTGTTLLGLSISGSVATVNLSGAFGSGDAAADRGQLAQVVYTLTQFPSVTRVVFLVDGAPMELFSTGGVSLAHAVGRADVHDRLPAIFVDRPAWGAAAGNPVTASGVANVFEATFRVQLLGATHGLLADRQVTASCGTGCWGDFGTTIPYAVTQGLWGTLRVFDLSAKDGSAQDVTEYPVWLTPAR
jgi:Sporulation and spore germination/Immunoglobulin-like domain of bacterial spore germination